MGLFRSRDVVGIAADVLTLARESAADAHPNEFMGLLRGDRAGDLGLDEEGYVVTDLIVIPATKTSPTSATIQRNLVPNDERALGSIHSHPNGVLRPSDEDLATFGNGRVHVILGAPYGEGDWAAFDRQGDRRELPVRDVDLADPEEFFDFTQADIDEELRE